MSFVPVAARSYEAFARGDMDAVLADMHADIEWHQAQGLAHGGVYRGIDEVRRNVFDPLDRDWWEEFVVTPRGVPRRRCRCRRPRPLPRVSRARRARRSTSRSSTSGRSRRAGGSVPAVPRHRGLGRSARALSGAISSALLTCHRAGVTFLRRARAGARRRLGSGNSGVGSTSNSEYPMRGNRRRACL